MTEKIIRDPVHDVIAFRLDRPTDALLFRLLNAEEFQRLRRIRQLGMANLAYPGADHSRYSHSLGVMETARRILAHLGQWFRIDPEMETACLAAALLHDLGHGPFSHVFERVSGIEHEKLTRRVISDPASGIHRILREFHPQLPERVLGLMEGSAPRGFYADVLSSQLDADRFDYLLRDNLMTGSGYGGYDLGWLLHALTIDEASGRLAVSYKGVSAVEAYLQSRYHMYRNVYFHKVVRSAEGMVKLALQRAKRLAVQGRLPWPGREDPVSKALLGQRMSIDEFVRLDDVSVMHCFKVWSDGPDPMLAKLCRGLLFRGLYKSVDVSHVPEVRVREAMDAIQRAIVAEAGEPAYEVFYDEPAETPYKVDEPDAEILVLDKQGGLIPLASISPLIGALNRQLMFRRIHFAGDWRDVVRKAVG